MQNYGSFPFMKQNTTIHNHQEPLLYHPQEFPNIHKKAYFKNYRKELLLLILLFIAIIILFILVPFINSNTNTRENYDYLDPPILLIGDSITQYGLIASRTGWTSLMSCAFVLRCDVINRGHWGANTDFFAGKVPFLVKNLNAIPSLVVVMLGTNDADLPSRLHLHVPIARYIMNLNSILRDIISLGIKRIILITPPPTRKWEHPESRFLYRNAMIMVSRKHNVHLLDTWSLFLNKSTGVSVDKVLNGISMHDYNDSFVSQYLLDSVHYNSLGNQLHWNGLKNVLNHAYPELNPWDKCW